MKQTKRDLLGKSTVITSEAGFLEEIIISVTQANLTSSIFYNTKGTF